MTMPSERDRYVSRCLRVSAAAENRGIVLAKVPGRHELEISSAGGSVVVPIVTDERAWRETTVEEAFYAVVTDARGWAAARLDDASLATLEDGEREMISPIRRDVADQLARNERLERVLGGADELRRLWESADLTL